MTDQLSLLAEPELKVGDVVWWTGGLKYLTTTYKQDGKIRTEDVAECTVLGIEQRENGWESIWIQTPYRDAPISTVRRWISTDPKVPCEAVLEANGIYL